MTRCLCNEEGTHSDEMAQHVDQLPRFRFLRQGLMERVELFGADFSVKYDYRKIRPVDPGIRVIVLVQVRLWPVKRTDMKI